MGKFYESRKWKKKREHILRRDAYQCQESKRYGKYAEATTVHHIYPLEEYPELALVDWNLISMSTAQHDRMHDRKTDKVTSLGMYWQRKRRREFEAWVAISKKEACEIKEWLKDKTGIEMEMKEIQVSPLHFEN